METEVKKRRKEIIVAAFNSGRTPEELEKEYGISAATIKTYIRDARVRAATEEASSCLEEFKKRNEEIVNGYESGMKVGELADKYAVSTRTIHRTLRAYKTSLIDPEILLSEMDMEGERKSTIRRWAKKQTGKILKTPEGEMLITANHNYIFECFKQNARNGFRTTYTHAELYYMNAKEGHDAAQN